MSSYPKTRFETNDNLTRKKWAKDLFKTVLEDIEYNYLVGSSTEDIVQLRTDLAKGEGDQITFGIMKELSGEGVVGRNTVEGNEESLAFTNYQVTIEELNHAVDTGGKMDEQRVPFDLMQLGKDALARWWQQKLSTILINTLVGNTAFKVAGSTFGNTITAPDSDHHVKVNDIAEASMTSADVLDLSFLDRVKQKAIVPPAVGCYKLRPLIKGGKQYYRVLLHDYVFDALRQNTNVAQWGDLKLAAKTFQMPEVEIEYNGMLISKSQKLPLIVASSGSTTTGVYRGVLMGCQAACFPWGGAGESKGTTMAFVPYEKDAKRYVMIRGGGIFGVKKTIFDSKDYGIYTFSSWGEPLS